MFSRRFGIRQSVPHVVTLRVTCSQHSGAGGELPTVSAVATKALKVPRHLSAKREIASIEPLDLLDTRPSVLGEVKDIDLSVAQDDPHTDSSVS